MNPLKELPGLGQVIWYDNLSRETLRSGELAQLIEEDGVTGVTTNPSIFEKALSLERCYDADLHDLVDRGLDAFGIYEGLVIDDVRAACDLIAPIYDRTLGTDGFVSMEVPPVLAYDKPGTIAAAKRLFERVERQNLLVKVPATPEGCEAGRDLIAAGVHVNFTLIFSLEQYQCVAHSYLHALQQRLREGLDISRCASVASFFISRIDTMIDQRLKESTDPAVKAEALGLIGKIGIANAKRAYRVFKELFHSERFTELRAAGARPQKIVWASTSTKNPEYPDTLYVDALIGRDTVNTLPQVALKAFRDHGVPANRLDEGYDEADRLMGKLDLIGYNTALTMDRLLDDGIRAFADSFNRLIEGIATKRTRLLRGWGHRSASMGELQQSIDETLTRLNQEKTAALLWEGDTSIFTGKPDSSIAKRLGWLHSVTTMQGEVRKLKEFADEVRDAGIKNVVLLGMGGSSLASEVFVRSFGAIPGYPELTVLDTTVPATILEAERRIDLSSTLFITAGKSGASLEVVSLHDYFWERVVEAGLEPGPHFIAITDPGSALGKQAAEHRFRKTFLNPSDIGSRFSALSYFGLVPAALIGIDVERLLMRAAQSVEACGPDVPALESPGMWLGGIMGDAAPRGRNKLTVVISPPIESFGLWLEHLVAESTGKEDAGIIPITGESLGAPEVYGDDRLFVYLRLDGHDAFDRQVSALETRGFPVATQRIHTAYDLGREMFRWEFSTAIAGLLLRINPFNKPNITVSREITEKILSAFEQDGCVPEGEYIAADNPELHGMLDAFLGETPAGAYIGINAFINPTPQARDALDRLRGAWRDRFRVATTLGFGPRYLHSTGQMHKGGPPVGRFVQITMDDAEDMSIPGASYSFGILKSAQALGDYEALKQKGRPIIRIHLKNDDDFDKLLETR